MEQSHEQSQLDKLIEKQEQQSIKLEQQSLEINNLKKEVSELNNKVIWLINRNSDFYNQQPIKRQTQQMQPVQQVRPVQQVAQNKQNIPNSGNNNNLENLQGVMNNRQPINVQKPIKNKSDMESKIGKTVMAVMASILIFFSAILFGGLLYSVVGETLRAVILLVISAIFTSVGLIKMKPNSKYNVLFTSIAGCGLGSFYITFILMYFLLNVINITVLLVLLTLWTITTAVISKKKSFIFIYICYIGTTISTILCAITWPGSLLGIIMYLVSIGLLFGLNIKAKYSNNTFFILQLPIVMLILSLISNDNSLVYQLILYTTLIVTLILQNILMKPNIDDSKDNSILTISTIVNLLVSGIILAKVYFKISKISDDNIYAIVSCSWIFTISIVLLGIVYYKRYRNTKLKNLVYIIYYIAIIIIPNCTFIAIKSSPLYEKLCIDYYRDSTLYINFVEDIWGYLPVAILLLVAGTYKRSNHIKIPGYVYLLLTLSVNPLLLNGGNIQRLLNIYSDFMSGIDFCAAILLIVTLLMIPSLKKNYNLLEKYIITFLSVLFTLVAIVDNFSISITIMIFTLISVFINSKYYTMRQDGQRETSSLIIGYMFNALLMLILSFILATNLSEYLNSGFLNINNNLRIIYEIPNTEFIERAILILSVIGLYSINVNKLITKDNKHNTIFELYICFKFMVLLNLLGYTFKAEGFIMSILSIAYAVIWITIGFKSKIKSFRLYGLIVTMLYVVKLVLFDIEYGTTLLKPLGFLAAGVLCLAISWLYSKLEATNKDITTTDESVANKINEQ